MSHSPANDAQDFGRFLVKGDAQGEIVSTNVPLSFMMGVNAQSGLIQDEHHPLRGTSIQNKILVVPRGRGSCSGSGVIIEMLVNGSAPAAFIFHAREDILTLGVVLAGTMFSKSIPVVMVEDEQTWASLLMGGMAHISTDGYLDINDDTRVHLRNPPDTSQVALSPEDDNMLCGQGCSAATKLAMQTIVSFAAIQGAASLISVSQVHIDACCYAGKVSLAIPQRLRELGGEFAVPTTCNSLDVDRRRWRELKADPELSEASYAIGDHYLAMGAQMSFTCAPYLLDTKPKIGEQVGWGESNAVVFANSVLGARTHKYPDYLEVMVALTGRAPYTGCHLLEERAPKIGIHVPPIFTNEVDESVFPLLGYHIGGLVGSSIPIIYGLETSKPITPDLKAFGAGFATTSSAPMFHIRGITPEAANYDDEIREVEWVNVKIKDLQITWHELNTARDPSADLISLGNPHFTLEEFSTLANLVRGKKIRKGIVMIITTGRSIYDQAERAGYIGEIQRFGASLITDTCWCLLTEPIIPLKAQNIMTNSSKYAHYGPGISRRRFHFGSLAGCVEVACFGFRSAANLRPPWLFDE
ncbi:hypothetical protein PFICI_14003 [Pestalotiopsis fici W106-1]|uniref:Aconitase X catalytic domain-containing protein n=1 Tax=Pestalotiopsis fici (strain W106-1 / CGMCC3.15140) TaxID=1229662 RepID=W3WLS9_PESFW|nr:uncharacterized protein PFICI_14003 [Pestalotiopsis fici W106-1]ETS74137.1 hypothetical protein PFICI_14003 [Pestalotiopsis fici W106-1]